MKRILSFALTAIMIGGICCSTPLYASETSTPTKLYECQTKEQMRQVFEQRLNLSERQKEKARAIHQRGKEQMKPIIAQIKEKKQEIEAVKLTRMAVRAQQERIAQIEEEIKVLKQQAREIRKENSKEFEQILNKKQRAELKRMKAEGRAKFEKNHPARTPFQGLGAPEFQMPKHLFPQQQEILNNNTSNHNNI